MAKQGAPHETMVEAFTVRLRQFYPEPCVGYSFGRVVRPPGLKPDIYVAHPDGRRWAFEMIHGNQSAVHLLKNHARYAEAGISDHWILWDTLRPQAGSPPDLDQGIMLSASEQPKLYPLTKPQQTILSMQSGDVRYLYSFTPTGFDKISDNLSVDYLRSLEVGVDIYRFEGWAGEDRYIATTDYVPISTLEFGPDGSLVVQESPWSDEITAQFMSQLGFTEDQPVFVREVLGNLQSVLSGENGQRVLLEATLLPLYEAAAPEDLQEVVEFFAARKSEKQAPPYESELVGLTIRQLLDDPGLLEMAAKEMPQLREYLSSLPVPALLKRW